MLDSGRATLSNGRRSALTPMANSTIAAPTISPAPTRYPAKTAIGMSFLAGFVVSLWTAASGFKAIFGGPQCRLWRGGKTQLRHIDRGGAAVHGGGDPVRP